MKRNNPFIPTIKKNFSSLFKKTEILPTYRVIENITETFPQTSFIRQYILGVSKQREAVNDTKEGGLSKGNGYNSTIRTQFAKMFFGMLDDIKKKETLRKNNPRARVVQEVVTQDSVEKNIKNNISLIISDIDRYDLRDGINLGLARLVYLKAFIIEFTAKIVKWHKVFSEIQRRDGDNNKTYIDVDYKEEFGLLLKKLESKVSIPSLNRINDSINKSISMLKEQLIREIDENLAVWGNEKEYKDSVEYYTGLKSTIQNIACTGQLLTQPTISFFESKQEKEVKNILNVGRIRLGANFSENEADENNREKDRITEEEIEEYNDQSIIVEEFENDFFLQNDFFTTGLMLVNSITSDGKMAKSAIGSLVCLFYLLTPESGLSDVYAIGHEEDDSIEMNPINVVTRGLGRLKMGGKDMDMTVSRIIQNQIEN